MSEDYKTYEIIERYLAGELNEAELRAFEAKMAKDAAFREEVEAHKELQQLLVLNEINEFKAKAKGMLKEERIEEQKQTKNTTKVYRLPTWFKAVALLLLLVGMGLLIYLNSASISNTQKTPQILAANYFEAPANLYGINITKSATNPVNKQWLAKANQAYQAKDYQSVIQQLEKLSESDTVAMANGLCYYELKNYSEAISHFQAVKQMKESLFSTKATWFLALTYLQNNQTEAGIKLLKELEAAKVGYHRKATSLLEALDVEK